MAAAGQPVNNYQRADREFAVSLPPRDYELAAEVFARGAEHDPTDTIRHAVQETARQAGRELAADSDATDLVDHLRRHGFEPYDDDGVLRLRNCPFHHLARQHTELACGMNLACSQAWSTAWPATAESPTSRFLRAYP